MASNELPANRDNSTAPLPWWGAALWIAGLTAAGWAIITLFVWILFAAAVQ